MLVRRVGAALRAQNWTAVAIELVIVVLGVFIGTQVSNWNQQRLEKHQVDVLLTELKPELHQFLDSYESADHYYATTKAYAKTAFAGWERRPGISDEQFVVAAYQASQVIGVGTSMNNWILIFGGDQLRNIDDIPIRTALSQLMTYHYETISFPAVATPYRDKVRLVIPDDVQDAIRQRCGDRSPPGRPMVFFLPATCTIGLTRERAAAIAASLRARPDLVGLLSGHQSTIATYFTNLATIENGTRVLSRKLDEMPD